MTQYRIIRNMTSGAVVLPRAEWTARFWGHLKGLMLRRNLSDDDGLLCAYGRESVLETAIHMLFMLYPIATIWLDKNGVVVDKVLAKPWRLSYAPHKPAQYFIEARPLILDRVSIGDQLAFDEQAH